MSDAQFLEVLYCTLCFNFAHYVKNLNSKILQVNFVVSHDVSSVDFCNLLLPEVADIGLVICIGFWWVVAQGPIATTTITIDSGKRCCRCLCLPFQIQITNKVPFSTLKFSWLHSYLLMCSGVRQNNFRGNIPYQLLPFCSTAVSTPIACSHWYCVFSVMQTSCMRISSSKGNLVADWIWPLLLDILLKISMHVPPILLKTTGTLEGIGSLATLSAMLWERSLYESSSFISHCGQISALT